MLWQHHRSAGLAFGNGVQVNLLQVAWEKVLAVVRRDALDREFDEEARSHIALATADYVRQGLPPDEALRRARLRFGSVATSLERHRESRGVPRIEAIAFEIRLALRGLRRDWTYATASIGMLTVALALNTTVFTVMDVMLFRGSPLVNRNDRLVYVQERCAGSPCGLSYADLAEWRDHARSFTALSFVGTRLIALRDTDGRQADLSTRIVTANTLRLLGVSPLLGRDFTDDDEADGAQPVAILSHRFWTQRYGANASVIGSTVQINGAPTVIIGVMPERFEFPSETSLWMPVTRTRELLRPGATAGSHVAVGRLQDGVTLPAALAELEAINSRLALTYPDTNRGRVPVAFTYAQFISGPDAPLMWGSLWAGSWFVMLIACANLANLTFVRTTGRWREFVTTMALGAG
jgi:hypothetical protein